MTTIAINRSTLKTQTLAICAAVIAAAALPQIFHLIGIISGAGSAPGQVFLPMYLPIILVGFLAGPLAGAAAGLLSPLVSFALSGMPTLALLPIITADLVFLGLAAGMLRSRKLPILVKVLAAQLAGKAAYAIAIFAAAHLFGSETLGASAIFGSLRIGLPGFLLQWVLVPLIIFRVENTQAANRPDQAE